MLIQFGAQDETYKATAQYCSGQEAIRATSRKQIGLVAARNQSAAFQAVLHADGEFLLCVSDAAQFDKSGLKYCVRTQLSLDDPALDLSGTIRLIGFVEDDDRVQKADIILNDDARPVSRLTLQPLWIELAVGKSAAPGSYAGRIELFGHFGFEPESRLGEISWTLEVLAPVLPDPRQYRFYLDLWQHSCNIARKHEVFLWSDQHFSILDRYLELLAGLGQKAASVIVSELPWSGQFCYRDTGYPSDLYEYNMVRVSKDRQGALQLDFNVLDRYIGLCGRHGIGEEISCFGLLNIWMSEADGFGKVARELSDGIRVRYLDERDGCYKYLDTAPEIAEYIRRLEQHFIEKKQISRIRIVADEPADLDVFTERVNFLKSCAPHFRFKAAICHSEVIREFRGDISDLITLFSVACDEYDRLMQNKGYIDGRLSWYVCCAPAIPNTFIRSDLTESLIIGPLTEYLHMDGFLRWAFTAWPQKPRERVSFRSPGWPAGDMFLVYPAANGEPLPSLRYKILQRGIQYFELMQMLKTQNPRSQEVLDGVFAKLFRFDHIAEFSAKQNRQIGSLISLNYADYQEALRTLAQGIASPPTP